MSIPRKYLYLLLGALALWLGVRYLLPVLLPFLLGGLLALAAEPAVRLGTDKLRLPRWLSAGLGVSMTLVALLGLLWLVCALLLKELGSLAQALPDLQETAQQGVRLVQTRLLDLSERMPENLGKLLSDSVSAMSGNGGVLLEQATMRLPGILTTAVGKVSEGVIVLGTGLVAAYLISSRLPQLRQGLARRLPRAWQEQALPALRRVRKALGGWLKAQGLLMLITYGIVCAGLLMLRIPYGPVWAVLIALVDAVPMLGTGTVLVPWALIELLRSRPLHATVLACIYGVALLTRSVLEPRLVGKHIGIDPLLTLFAMYAGYRFFGFLGLLLSPVAAAAVKAAIAK